MEFRTRVSHCITRVPAAFSGRVAQVAPPLEYYACAHSRLIDKEQSAQPTLSPSVSSRSGLFIRDLREYSHEFGAVVVESAVRGHCWLPD